MEPLEDRRLLAVELEPNDTLAEATPFTPAGSGTEDFLQGEIATSDDVDVFQTTLTYGQRMRVESYDTTVEILDGDGDVKSASRDFPYTRFVAPRDGTYYIRLTSDLAYGELVGPYRPTVRVDEFVGESESEPNDLSSSSNPLATPAYFRGSLATAADVDYFAVEADANQAIIVQFSDAPAKNPAVRLYDGSNNLVASELTGLGLRAQVPADGTYFVRLSRDNAAGSVTGQYVGQLSVHDVGVWSNESNNQFGSATEWSLDTPETHAIGDLRNITDVDCYAFETNGLEFLYFDIRSEFNDDLSAQNRVITLYDEFLRPLQYSTIGFLDTSSRGLTAPLGQYYVTVEATNETGLGPYAMVGKIDSTFSAVRDVPLFFVDFDGQESHMNHEWVNPYASPEAIPLIVGRFDAQYDVYDIDVTLTKPTDGSEHVSNGMGDFGGYVGGTASGVMGTRRPNGDTVTGVPQELTQFQDWGTKTLLHEAGHGVGLRHARHVLANMAYHNQTQLNPVGSFYPFPGGDSRIADMKQVNQRDYLDWVTQAGRQITEVEPNDTASRAQRLGGYLGDMQIELPLATAYDVTGAIAHIVTGDFNGDGLADTATAAYGDNQVRILLGQGDGALGPEATYGTGNLGYLGEPLAVGDLNGDGREDLVTANHRDTNISVLLANPDGSFQDASRIELDYLSLTPTIADLNGDGKLDVAVARPGRVFVLIGNGDGTFQDPAVYTTSGTSYSIVAVDLTGDEFADLVVTDMAAGGVSVLVNNGDGTFQQPTVFATGSSPYSMTVADFDSDNHPDLAVVDRYEDKVTILRGLPDGSMENSGDILLGFRPELVQAADLDGDGNSDLCIGAYGMSFHVLRGLGDGTFGSSIPFPSGQSPLSVAAADFNGDSRIDLVSADYHGRTVTVHLTKPNDVRNDRGVVHGRISQTSDVDVFELTVSAGQTYVFDIDSAEFQYPLDASISLYDSNDRLLAANSQARDGDTGLLSVDPYLVHTFAEGGPVKIRVAGERGTAGNYRLKVSPSEALDQDGPRVIYALPGANNSLDSTRQLLFWFDDQLDPDTLTGDNILVQGNASGIVAGTATFDPLSSLLIWAADIPLPADTYSVTLKSAAGGITDLKGNPLDGETDGLFTLPDVSGDGTVGGDFMTSFVITASDPNAAAVYRPTTYQRNPYNRGLFTVYLDDELDVASVQSAHFVLRGTGPDNMLGTADDRQLPLDVWYDTLRYSSSEILAYTRGIPEAGNYRIEAVFLDAAGHTVNLSEDVTVTASPLVSGPSVIDVNVQPGSVTSSTDLVAVDFSTSVDPASLTTANFILRYSANAEFFDGDDTLVPDADGTIAWDAVHQRAILEPQHSLQDGFYLIELNGDAGGITDPRGRLLDGEFLDSFIQGAESIFLWEDAPSGDGREGGDYVAHFSVFTDTVGVTVRPTSDPTTTESGGTATFSVVLDSQPTRDVVITVSSSDTSEGTVPTAPLTFKPEIWFAPQFVKVTGIGDDVDDGDVTFAIQTQVASNDPLYNEWQVADATVTNVDDDSVGVTVTPLDDSVTEELLDTAQFMVVLNSEPIADVTVTVASDDETEGTVSPASLVFTADDWKQPKTFTVTAVNDDVDDGDVMFAVQTQVASNDLLYNDWQVADATVTNVDDDSVGVTVTPLDDSVTEELLDTAEFTVVLNSEPIADVTVTVASDDETEGTVSPASLVFTADDWQQPKTFTVTAVNDDVDDGDVTFAIQTQVSSNDLLYNEWQVADATVTNVDDDSVGVTVTPLDDSVTEELLDTAQFTVVLNSEPIADVTVTVASDDETEGTVSPESLVFTADDWQQPKTFTVTGVNDDVDDGDVTFAIQTQVASNDPLYNEWQVADATVTNVDDDSVGVAVTQLDDSVTEEPLDTAEFTLVLNSEPIADVTVTVASDDETEGTVSPESLVFTADDWQQPKTFTVTGVNDDVDDGDVTFAIQTQVASNDPLYNEWQVADATVTSVDDDTAGVTVRAFDASGMFPGQMSSVGGNYAEDMVLEDFDEDGDLDVALIRRTAGVFAVMRGRGDGTFDTPVDTVVGSSVLALAAADMNGDGHTDLLTTPNGGTFGVSFGRGDGTFDSPVRYPVLGRLYDILVADIDADGFCDVVLADIDGRVLILPGRGDGTFDSTIELTVAVGARSLAVGHFNDDAHLDLATANCTSGNVSVLLGQGSRTFQDEQLHSVGEYPISVEVADLDGDHRDDLIAANYHSSDISVFYGQGNGEFWDELRYPANDAPRDLLVHDVNQDGRRDLLVANGPDQRTITVLLRQEDGSYARERCLPTGSAPFQMIPGDVNNDGLEDLAVLCWSSETVAVHLGRDDGFFAFSAYHEMDEAPVQAVLGDFNNDGHLDTATANTHYEPGNYHSTVTVRLGTGNGTFEQAVSYDVTLYSRSPVVGDFNGDGYLDLVVAKKRSEEWTLLFGHGDGTFDVTSYLSGASTESLIVADFDRDGHSDLLSINRAGENRWFSVHRGDDSGSFELSQTTTLDSPLRPTAVVEDFNTDGFPDIAIGNVDDQLLVFLGIGDGTFHGPQIYDRPITHYSLVAGDFNGDGHADLFAIYEDSRVLLLGSGDGTFSVQEFPGVTLYAADCLVADFNQDGFDDVAVYLYIRGTWILFSRGNGTFAEPLQYATGSYVSPDETLFAAGDINEDGWPDLVFPDNGTSSVAVSLQNSHEILETDEAGEASVFTVVLDSQPLSDVTVTVVSSDTTEATTSLGEVTFTPGNWNVPRAVTVTGMNDDMADGNVEFAIRIQVESEDSLYDQFDVADVMVTNMDDDEVGVTVTPVDDPVIDELAGTAEFTVVLNSEPIVDVTVTVASDDETEGTVSPASLVFTADDWHQLKTFTVTAVNDDVDDGDVTFGIQTQVTSNDLLYNEWQVPDATVTNVDDDLVGVTVTQLDDSVREELLDSAEFTVVLDSEPIADVTIAVASDDEAEGTVSPTSLVFTAGDWQQPKTFTVTGVNDDVDDGDVTFAIQTQIASNDPLYDDWQVADATVTNVDDDSAGITVTPTSGLVTDETGGTATFTVRLDSQPTADVTVAVATDDATEGTVGISELVFTPANWQEPGTVTVLGVDDQLDDDDVAYMIVTTAVSDDPKYNGLDVADVSVTNADDDAFTLIELGPVDFRRLDSLSPAGDELWFRLETMHDGWLTAQAVDEWTADELMVRLFEPTNLAVPVATSTVQDGKPRLDHGVQQGQTYLLQVTGTTTDTSLLLANLVHEEGDAVTVHGTAEADVFAFDAAVSREIAINGVAYHYEDAQVSTVEFAGGDGRDVAWLYDSAGDETVEAWPDHVLFANEAGDSVLDYTVVVTGIEDLQAYATRGGTNSAVFHGSEGGDKLKSYEDSVRLRAKDSSYTIRGKKFDSIVSDSGTGGKDLAVFNGTDGNETFTYLGAGSAATVEGKRRVHTATGFASVVARAGSDGTDVAHFTDMPGTGDDANDRFYFKSHKTQLVGADVKITVRAFDQVYANASEDGFDVARIYDTLGDEHLEVEGNTVRLYRYNGDKLELLYEAVAFELAKCYSSNSSDTKDIRDHVMDLYLYDLYE